MYVKLKSKHKKIKSKNKKLELELLEEQLRLSEEGGSEYNKAEKHFNANISHK